MENHSQNLSIVETNPLNSQAQVSSFLSLFYQQVIEKPHKTALIYKDHSISYEDLAQLSTAYSDDLTNRGVTSGHVVMVMLPRSIELIPLLIAVMRLGATYIPIDIKHPVKSIERIIKAAQPDFTVCSESIDTKIADQFPKLEQLLIKNYAELRNKLSENEKKNTIALQKDSFHSVEKHDPAYIIYTSGSTGIPKGVRISHHGLSSFLLGIQDEIDCSAEDRFAALTTISFDISGLEMYLPLTLGATLVIVPQEENVNPYKLAELLNKEQVSVLQATPATFRLLITGGWTASNHLKKILCGGEALTQELSNQLVDSADGVWNVYGPTEATIWATSKKVTNHNQTPTIGKPLAGYECLVLDDKHQPTPLGEAGELYIAGLALAKDYYNNKEKTDEHFFSIEVDGQQKRVYKTGDKALINTNGDIEYLGRLDFQVKVRGFRVELPEIEHIANTHPAVTAFAAIACKAPSGENIIKGFYTLKAGFDCDTDQLHKFLSENLAHYMLPSMLHKLDDMPLNTNGKIDRNKLTAMTLGAEITASSSKPNSFYIKDFDYYIYRAWCESLGLSDCKQDDNFFLLGGSSIIAVQFIKRVEQLTNSKIPLGLLFKAPKLNEFLKALREINSENAIMKVPLNKAARENSGNQQLYFVCGINIYKNLVENLPQNIESHAIYIEVERKLVKENKVKSDKTPTQRLASIYVDSIAENLTDKPISLCGISYGGLLAIEIATQLQQRNINTHCVYMLDSSVPGAVKSNILRRIYRKFLIKIFQLIEKSINTLGLGDSLASFKRYVKIKYMRASNDDLFEAAINASKVDHIDYSGEIVLIKASDESSFWNESMHQSDYGWQEALNRKINTIGVPGDHLGIIDEQNAANVANIINS